MLCSNLPKTHTHPPTSPTSPPLPTPYLPPPPPDSHPHPYPNPYPPHPTPTDHEVWHTGTQDRVVLLFDLWHPDLVEGEKEALVDMFHTARWAACGCDHNISD